MQKPKLQLNKEIIARLKKDETLNVYGGEKITAILTQGPGCQSRTRPCIAVMNDPDWANPMTSYCQSGYELTCGWGEKSCGGDVWC